MKSKSENILLVGFPSNGLVGTFTISYLIHYLGMKQIGEIDHPDLPPTLFVENGEILTPIRIYKKNNIHVIISDIPFDPYAAYTFGESVLNFCKKNGIQKIIIVSGLETMNQDPSSRKIFGLTTHKSLEETLYTNRIQKFLSGSIFGTDAALISVFRKSTVPALILYAECHPFFPDPEAAVNATSSLAKILNIKINTDDIKRRIERLRIQHRNLMEQTIKKLQQQREDSQSLQPKAPQIYK